MRSPAFLLPLEPRPLGLLPPRRFLIGLGEDEFERPLVIPLDRNQGGAVKHALVVAHPRDAGPVHGGLHRRLTPILHEELCPLSGRALREPERHGVQGAAPRVVVARGTNLLGDYAHDPHSGLSPPRVVLCLRGRRARASFSENPSRVAGRAAVPRASGHAGCRPVSGTPPRGSSLPAD